MTDKPRQNFAGLWNISFGFFGIQIGFALQNANMSRIFQSLGAELDDLSALWIAAPLTGLLVQPIVGHLSDRTWLGKLGRRRPYFLAGAILATIALLVMPESTVLWFSVLMLWILDASINISMEPFRAFVGDMLRKDQHSAGYAVQTAFIGAGAVVGSIFPYALEQMNVSNVAAGGGIPDTVRYSFWFGGLAFLASVLWTVFKVPEYSPQQMAAFDADEDTVTLDTSGALVGKGYRSGIFWIAFGLAVIFAVFEFALEKEVYLLGLLLAGYGAVSMIAILLARGGKSTNMLSSIVGDFSGMPVLMKRLALVQFFSWSALFIMWINTTPVVAQYAFGSVDPDSALYQEAGNWVGVLFTVYNGVAALVALTLLPWLSRRFGQVHTHVIGLVCGAIGFASFFVLRDPQLLLISEIGIGIFWASVLAMPYAILASSLPQKKLGIYMGLFNIFVVLPQLLVATAMGSIMKTLFPGDPIWTMAFAAGTLFLAALAMLRVGAAMPNTHKEASL